ncbi:hypothetical protein A9264_14115 [Vibrio sp. UCD-FRSSP16_10]|uniref:SDR family NAD(P)-dependent oxidoreductase n=1 Tax=unclassified Vibrio TaxID=2614977 RepID=UPI0007FFF3BF|nr:MULTISPECIES: SDR family oxidoreductase [unclassified Vibrio]OBT13245.1 hypothetical protein A9260_14495 [Vibrio sp. UCD-FRSSP16_30]OBT19595.1 hypothetical protein A9264_14115 [Vibrio sp. UCD-FRSSP16_10]
MDLGLKDKNVVITGGSTGIGAAMVKRFLDEGANVYFCGRNQQKITALLNELDDLSQVHAKQLDVTIEADFNAWITEIGVVDIFIPNVSAMSGDWGKTIETDLLGTIRNVEAVIPAMTGTEPAVSFIGSVSAIMSEQSSSYASIKAALTQYIHSLSQEHAGKIRFNTIAPASTLFPGSGWDQFRVAEPELFAEKANSHPMKRLATAEEISDVVTFISSPKASYISGEVIHVDGGQRTSASL